MLYASLIEGLLAKYTKDDDLPHARTNLLVRIGNGYQRFITTCREDVIGAYANGYPVADVADGASRETKSGKVAPCNLDFYGPGLDRVVTLKVRSHIPTIHPTACAPMVDSIVAYARIAGLLARSTPKNGAQYNARKSGVAACEQSAMDALAKLSELDAPMWDVWCADAGKAYLTGPEAALLDIDGHGQTTGAVDKGDSARIRNDETAEVFTKNGRALQSGGCPVGYISERDFMAREDRIEAAGRRKGRI